MAMSTTDDYGEKAEECRQQAEKAINEMDKAEWQASWLKLAQDQRSPQRNQ
jgi:hypothetical protein